MRLHQLAAAFVVAILIGRATLAQPPAASHEINKPFEKPNVRAFVKRFESEDREVFARREAIVEALGLRPGMAVADIGAGTGLFTRLIADQVGPRGKVYAVDIARAFLEHIAAESRRLGQAQVATILGTQTSTSLPAESVDLVFLCDVYHHIENPPAVLASIHRALRPGGSLVVVEFDRVEGKSTPFVLQHVRAGKEVFIAEIEAAGFERVAAPQAPRLKENVFLRFRRKPVETAPSPAAGESSGSRKRSRSSPPG